MENNYLINSFQVLDKLPSLPIRLLDWQDCPSFLFYMAGRRRLIHSSQAYIFSVQVTLPDWTELDTPCSTYRWERDRERERESERETPPILVYLIHRAAHLGVMWADTSGSTLVTLSLLTIEILGPTLYLSPAEGQGYVSLYGKISLYSTGNLNLPKTAQLK